MKRISSLLAVAFTVCVLAAPAEARPDPVARQAGAAGAAVTVAVFALQTLGNYLANTDAGGMGTFLKQLGFGDATAAKLDQIQASLNEINAKLDVIAGTVDQINASVEKGRCEQIQVDLSAVASSIKFVWREALLTAMEARTASPSVQKGLDATLRERIRTLRPGEAVIRIHDALVGTAGSPSMINNCGVAVQVSGDFVTSSLREKMDSVLEYWQGLEAEAAVLNIGLYAAEDRGVAADNTRAEIENNLARESGMLKPSLEAMVADRRTDRLWKRAAITFWFNDTVSRDALALEGWELPGDQLAGLLKNCCGSLTLATWMQEKTPFQIPPLRSSLYTPALLTSGKLSIGFGPEALAVSLTAVGVSGKLVGLNERCLALLVSTRSASPYLYSS